MLALDCAMPGRLAARDTRWFWRTSTKTPSQALSSLATGCLQRPVAGRAG